MKHKMWLFFLAGWLLSIAFGPKQLMGMFASKKAG
jgi:hypothetical protein